MATVDIQVHAAAGPPVPSPRSAARWVRAHLFGRWYDGLLTVAFAALFIWAGISLARWLLVTSDWEVVRTNLTLFMVGRFPRDELWRVWVATGVGAILVGLASGAAVGSAAARAQETGQRFVASTPREWLRRFWPLLALLALLLQFTRSWTPTLLALVVLVFGVGSHYLGRRPTSGIRQWTWLVVVVLFGAMYVVLAGFGGVGWQDWGGFQLTLFLTVAGILFAFPIGLLAAIGRRSSLPAVRLLSVGYIEFVRGVPLITLLLMGAFALGFLLPPGVRPGTVTRILVAIALFEGAYVAEVVRGGLQAVPKGQVEAAQALGLSPPTTLRLVVLPQALRATIPAMVGQFISLYKDTSLASAVGLIEVLRVHTIVNTQPEFLGRGLAEVTLPFVGLIYWVGSFTMSREARRLERRLGVGER